MERIDYVRAAIENDQEMYDAMETDAYYWAVSDEPARDRAARDFVTLYAGRVAEFLPWLEPSAEEIREGYREAVEMFAAESLPVLLRVRSGSAIYWDMAEGLYLVCERSAYGVGWIEIVRKADSLNEALIACDIRAGFCRPMEEYPERLYSHILTA